MPVRNIFTIQPGSDLKLDPIGFLGDGPRIQVEISVHPALEAILQAAKKPTPAPVIGMALVDTGASITSVDATIISTLGIPSLGPIIVGTPSGAAVQQKHACRIAFPGSNLSPVTFNFVCGSDLKKMQGIDALIGRDVLANYVLIYNGPGAHFTLSG